ncbi:sugar phosphate isomerase/epimerase [Paenibacillus doosanensis]|uniref:Xylose isomerase-like TIM barrel n=1 Tax=Paenibacillus konkukensis TaxID=2020716 RepID=A0ABY4RLY9_9BACL|nr:MULTISPECIES: sugar phosphate isomerase/epimerase [Paenibacillus]MCS7463510.1 sugar phosphate isomerase/epimerase [Paenibacillus doosanensis]UQZ83406.1 Xylose isomerase-like TIM barrel [Paenibacillus konkukensis]
MSVGILAHNVGTLPYKELAAKVASYQFKYVQLALSKAISDVDCSLGKLSPGLANNIAEAFDRNGVKIPVLGCYVSLIELDDAAFRRNVDRFKEHLRMARHFGTAIVATETGVPDTDQFDRYQARLKSAVEELAEEAEKWGVFIGLEAANRHLIGSAPQLAELIDEIPSSNIGVVIDPVNLMTQSNYENQHEVMQEAFRLLGSRVVSVHAKDMRVNENGKLETVSSGRGMLNYRMFMELVQQHKPQVHITLEGVQIEHMDLSRDYVLKHLAEV